MSCVDSNGSRGVAKRFRASLYQQPPNPLSLFLLQFSWRLRPEPEQRHLLPGAVLHQLPGPHVDAVLDHRARRLPGLQVHRRLQAAQTQLRLRGEAVHGVGERPAAHHVPGEEGRLHRDRGGRVPQHDRGEVRVHHGQRLHSMKSWKTQRQCFLIGVLMYLMALNNTSSTFYLNGHLLGVPHTHTTGRPAAAELPPPSTSTFYIYFVHFDIFFYSNVYELR